MFKAKLGDKIVNLKKKEWLLKEEYVKANRKQFKCQSCNGKVLLGWGPIRDPYFRHDPDETRDMDCYYEGESEKHVLGKQVLYDYFETNYRDVLEAIEIESFISETRQIADLLLKFKDGSVWAIEYQCSNISEELVRKRRSLYREMGIRDIWIVGDHIVEQEGMLNFHVKSIGQFLLEDTSFGNQSLFVLNPYEKQILILRELQRQNQRIFTTSYHIHCRIDEVSFNLRGECFSFIDIAEDIDYSQKLNKLIFSTESIELVTFVDHLYPSDISYYDYYMTEKNKEKNNKYYIKVPLHLKKYVPKALKDIFIDGYFIINHSDESMISQFIPLKLYPSSWYKPPKNNNKTSLDPTWDKLSNLLFSIVHKESYYERMQLINKGVRSYSKAKVREELARKGLVYTDIDFNKFYTIEDLCIVILKIKNEKQEVGKRSIDCLKELRLIQEQEEKLPLLILTLKIFERLGSSVATSLLEVYRSEVVNGHKRDY